MLQILYLTNPIVLEAKKSFQRELKKKVILKNIFWDSVLLGLQIALSTTTFVVCG